MNGLQIEFTSFLVLLINIRFFQNIDQASQVAAAIFLSLKK